MLCGPHGSSHGLSEVGEPHGAVPESADDHATRLTPGAGRPEAEQTERVPSRQLRSKDGPFRSAPAAWLSPDIVSFALSPWGRGMAAAHSSTPV